MRTITRFWTRKRFVKLFLFALLMGNVTLYCVGMLARRQVMDTAIRHHNKVYTAYLQTVERSRKPAAQSASAADASVESNIEPKADGASKTEASKLTEANSVANSPYWLALRETRRQFPYHRVNVVLDGAVDAEAERRIFEVLKNRPRGWTVTDEAEGWARTFYVLPSRNTAALQVTSYVRDDIREWENTALLIGAYGFFLLFAFGWFWTRALDDAAGDSRESGSGEDFQNAVRGQLSSIQTLSTEIGASLDELSRNVDAVHQKSSNLDEMLVQIRLLAINGSVEAARNAESYRVFHVIMQEINQLAASSRELVSSRNGSCIFDHLASVQQRLQSMNPTSVASTSGARGSRSSGGRSGQNAG
ncbi:MAG: methyl-accepting chemotaxis protein [Bdellovibrionota bacterium]